MDVAKSLENRCDVPINMWDITEENNPDKYDGVSIFLRKLYNNLIMSNFFLEEEPCKFHNSPHVVTRELIEIRVTVIYGVLLSLQASSSAFDINKL